jgi:hypothetical protein
MWFLQWIANKWFTLFQSAGIIGSLLLTAIALHDDTKSRRASNLIEIAKSHREIWSELYRQPELARITKADVDLKQSPVSIKEEVFVRGIILHLNSAYHAMRSGMLVQPEGLQKDVQQFFGKPIVKMVWERLKPLQDQELIRFVEESLSKDQREVV